MKARWIISRKVDLALVSGSALAGYFYLALHLIFQVPFSWLWWFWSVGFDGTHIFATVSRTYLDRQQRRQRAALLWGSLAAFFSLGPLMVLAGWKLPLAILVGVWAYYHVVRQHFGFLRLYHVKNGEMSPRAARIDAWFLGLMLAAPPFVRFFIHSPQELGMPAGFALARLIPWLEPAIYLLLAALTLLYLRESFSGPVNWPKQLLVAAVVPLHWLTFRWMGWQAAVPTVTIVHNLQYHALVWFHNQNKYGSPEAAAQHGRMPVAVAQSFLLYAATALLFSLAYRLPGFHLGKISDLAFGFFCGFGFTHYYLDSKIWRIRGDAELKRALRLDSPVVAYSGR